MILVNCGILNIVANCRINSGFISELKRIFRLLSAQSDFESLQLETVTIDWPSIVRHFAREATPRSNQRQQNDLPVSLLAAHEYS